MHQQHLRHPAAAVCATFLGLVCLAASGQTIYRCGNSYSDAPCAGASKLAIDDSRSPAQKAQTDAATVRTRTLAQQMERERLTLEKSVMAAKPPGRPDKVDIASRPASGTATPHATKTAKTTEKKPPAQPFFTAATTPDKKNKATGSAAD